MSLGAEERDGQYTSSEMITRVRSLCLDERQQPVFQVQMRVRRRIPFLKIVPLDAVLAKLGIAKPQLIFSQEAMHFMAPIAVGRSASNREWFQHKLRSIALVYASPPSSPGGSMHGCHSSSSA